MRLICPNCSAQYEIDVTLVPDEGRDVQCSNCGHTWFELPPPPEEFSDTAEENTQSAEAAEDAGSEDAKPDTSDAEDTSAEGDAETPSNDAHEDTGEDTGDGPSHAALAMAAASEDSAEVDEIFDDPPAAALPQQRRPADAAALEILKEEAERELSQRRAAPSEPMETQTDMGLDEIRERKTPSRALRARDAHLKEDSEDLSTEDHEWPVTERQKLASQAEVISQPDQDGPRRDLLPDIDEINSTLKSTRRRDDAAADAPTQSHSGFRTGFLGMTLLAIVMIIAYAQAPAIARVVPGSESALIPYVDGANSVRDWIDGLLRSSDA